MFSHGVWGSDDGYVMLTEWWASHGYATIQLNHAASRALDVKVGDPLVFRDWESRSADASFMLDSLADFETKAAYACTHAKLFPTPSSLKKTN